jgi:hypothetical protein
MTKYNNYTDDDSDFLNDSGQLNLKIAILIFAFTALFAWGINFLVGGQGTFMYMSFISVMTYFYMLVLRVVIFILIFLLAQRLIFNKMMPDNLAFNKLFSYIFFDAIFFFYLYFPIKSNFNWAAALYQSHNNTPYLCSFLIPFIAYFLLSSYFERDFKPKPTNRKSDILDDI